MSLFTRSISDKSPIDTSDTARAIVPDTIPRKSFDSTTVMATLSSQTAVAEEKQSNPNFLENLFKQSMNSPPRNDNNHLPDMTKNEVEQRMQRLLFYPVSLLRRFDKDLYRKVAWIVGKGLDKYLARYWLGARVLLLLLLSKHCEIGKRFHAIYDDEGDMTSDEASNQQESFFSDLAGKIHPAWNLNNNNNNHNCFTLFGSKEHRNMEIIHQPVCSLYSYAFMGEQ